MEPAINLYSPNEKSELIRENYQEILSVLAAHQIVLWEYDIITGKCFFSELGQEAINSFIRESPDLILMDIRMPVMDGIQATEKIRTISLTVPIIAVTAYAFYTEQQQAIQAGCKKGENCIVVASGANGTLSIDDIQNAEPAIKQASIVIMQLETPIESVTYAAKMAKKDKITVILNPAPAPTQQLPDDLLTNVDILIPNVTEAEIISGMHITDDESAKEAIRYISSKGIKTVIITMGAKGALAYENDEFIHIPAFKVKAVDTTAAGDTFCGGLCVALSEGKNLKDAIIFASRASSISVTRMGAQISIPLRKEIQ